MRRIPCLILAAALLAGPAALAGQPAALSPMPDEGQAGCQVARVPADADSLAEALASGSPAIGLGLHGSALLAEPGSARSRHMHAYSILRAMRSKHLPAAAAESTVAVKKSSDGVVRPL